jgi:hypothetical protein
MLHWASGSRRPLEHLRKVSANWIIKRIDYMMLLQLPKNIGRVDVVLTGVYS